MLELLRGILRVCCWIKHQLVIYRNDKADGTNGCVVVDRVAAPAEAARRLQPVHKPRCESISGFCLARQGWGVDGDPVWPCSLRDLQPVDTLDKPSCHL